MSYKYNPETDTVEFMTTEQNLYDFFSTAGFFFPHETLTRYCLSLKTKPFVILSGISGTGKTKIAQLFADYICQNENQSGKERRIAFIPVRPDWTDSKSLLGYYNVLDEKYHATRLLELLLDAAEEPGKPFFVILDEMNIAKVEHYFSDFLSILESRTPDRPEGEAIHLHPLSEVETINGRKIPGAIYVPPNVFFSGTVNVDESTYMFSPKVLDRANVIEFNEVNLAAYADDAIVERDYLSLIDGKVIETFFEVVIDTGVCKKEDYINLDQQTKRFLQEIHHILREYNLHFGYRVVNELGRFVNLALKEIGDSCLNDAIDIQILQKILPKMHGTRAKLKEPLQRLFAFCCDENITFSEELLSKALSDTDTFRFPRSATKTSRMLNQLSFQGYAGFIE